jgi:hypothetical protein
MLASWNGRVHAVELLSAAGAKVQMRDKVSTLWDIAGVNILQLF